MIILKNKKISLHKFIYKSLYYKDNGYSFIDYGLKKFKVDKIDVQNLVLGNSKGIECKKWNKV